MDPNPRIADFTDDFIGEFLHWDGKFPATLRALTTRPGLLSADFMAGRRRRWLSPFRLYLMISIIYFLSGPIIERVTGFSSRAVARLEVTGDSATREDLRLLSDSAAFVNAPEIRENRIVALIGPEKAWALLQNQTMMKDIVAEAVPKVMFILMPFFALLTWLAWRSTGLNYPAHLVFSFHLHSAYFVAMFVSTLIEPIGILALTVLVQFAALAYSTWYTIVASRVALGGTGREVAIRTSVVGLLYLPAVLFAVMIATILAINAL
jgi:hypothetical protein